MLPTWHAGANHVVGPGVRRAGRPASRPRPPAFEAVSWSSYPGGARAVIVSTDGGARPCCMKRPICAGTAAWPEVAGTGLVLTVTTKVTTPAWEAGTLPAATGGVHAALQNEAVP